MAAGDKFKVEIACPQCVRNGQLNVSENDYPFMRKPNRRIDRIHGDFRSALRRHFIPHHLQSLW